MKIPQTPEQAADLHEWQKTIVAGSPRGRIGIERKKLQILMAFRLAFAARAGREGMAAE